MTTLLGSKRWITAIAAAGALVAVSGCTASGPDDGGSAAPSASSDASPSAEATSEVPTPSAEPSASDSPSASAAPSAEPSASASPSASAAPSPSTSPSPSASPAPSPSVSPPAGGGLCSAAQLTGTIQDQLGGAGAGSVYRTLVLTNASDQECTVEGYPGVSFVDGSGTQIGAPADRDGSAAAVVILAPGASATTTLQQTNARNYGADCGLTPAAGLRVYPPGATDSLVLPQEIAACSATSIVLMTVGALQPAS